jgi:hypothetical protein
MRSRTSRAGSRMFKFAGHSLLPEADKAHNPAHVFEVKLQ